jgi:putative addiction module killer protein
LECWLGLVKWYRIRYHYAGEPRDQRTAVCGRDKSVRGLVLVARCLCRRQGERRRVTHGAGNLSSVEWFRGIGEYRIDWGPGLRIYLAKDGLKLIMLIGGGTKKRQRRDIDQAVALWADYKRRKAATRKET